MNRIDGVTNLTPQQRIRAEEQFRHSVCQNIDWLADHARTCSPAHVEAHLDYLAARVIDSAHNA